MYRYVTYTSAHPPKRLARRPILHLNTLEIVHSCAVIPFDRRVLVLSGPIAGQFVVQVPSKACTADTILATVSECSSAKAALDPDDPDDPDAADVKSENNEQNPKGCSRWQGKWFFNSHATGALDGVSELICKAGNAKRNFE